MLKPCALSGKRRRRAVELQPQSVADKSACCPLCGKAGIRLVAFIDAAGSDLGLAWNWQFLSGYGRLPLPQSNDLPCP